MQFKFPQFIDVEDKIFGPLTLKQFIYLAGSGGIIVVFFIFLPKFFAVILGLPVLGLGLALAFYKVNNRPFMFVLESAFKYATKEKLYIWKKENKPGVGKERVTEAPIVPLPKLGESKLKDLSWNLDVTKGGPEEQDKS